MCVLVCALCVAAEHRPADLSVSQSNTGLYVCLHTCRPGRALPSSALMGAETSQDRRANKAYSLSLGPAGEKWRKRPISVLCKPLFHFHTSLSLSLLIFHRVFGPCSSVNTIQLLRSWLTPPGLSRAPALLATSSCSKKCHNVFLFFPRLNLSQDAAQTDPPHPLSPSPISLSLAFTLTLVLEGPVCR